MTVVMDWLHLLQPGGAENESLVVPMFESGVECGVLAWVGLAAASTRRFSSSESLRVRMELCTGQRNLIPGIPRLSLTMFSGLLTSSKATVKNRQCQTGTPKIEV